MQMGAVAIPVQFKVELEESDGDFVFLIHLCEERQRSIEVGRVSYTATTTGVGIRWGSNFTPATATKASLLILIPALPPFAFPHLFASHREKKLDVLTKCIVKRLCNDSHKVHTLRRLGRGKLRGGGVKSKMHKTKRTG